MDHRKELIKHVAAIRISNDVGLLGRKIWNILLLNAYDELLIKEEHMIPITVLSEVVGYNSHSYSSLNRALSKLQTTLVTWDIDGGCEIKGAWIRNRRRYQMMGTCEINNGMLHYWYPHKFPELLYNPKIYRKINIAQQKLFKSSYGLALWENTLRFTNTKSTGWAEVQQWRELLGATSKNYNDYYRFNDKVLKPSIKEVNNVSDINITLKTKKIGRKIVEIKFDIKEKKPQNNISDIQNRDEYKSLIQHGIHKVKAIKYIEEFGHKYIQEKIEYTQNQDKDGKIKSSLSGYLVKAIENDWKSQDQVKAIQEKADETQKNQQKEWEKQLKLARNEALESYINKQNDTQKKQLKADFEKSAIFKDKMRNDHYVKELYSVMKTFDEVLHHQETKRFIRRFIFLKCVDNTTHLKSLEAWKKHHNIH